MPKKIKDGCYSLFSSLFVILVLACRSYKSKMRFHATLYQERAVFGKMKMDPAKWAQTQNAGEVSLLQWFFSQSVELVMDKVLLHCIRPMLLK